LDLSIDHEPTEKVLDAFEDVYKGIVACPHILGRLAVRSCRFITRQRERARITRTERRTPIPARIGFEGGNA